MPRQAIALWFSWPEKSVRSHMVGANTKLLRARFEEIAKQYGDVQGIEIQLAIESAPPIVMARKEMQQEHITYTDEWRKRFGEDGPKSIPVHVPRP